MKAFIPCRDAKIINGETSPRRFDFGFLIFTFKPLRLGYVCALKCLFILFVCCQTSAAQEDLTDAPPPLKILTRAEKSRLEAETDVKRRTILSIESMEAKLLKAESLAAAEDYPAMFTELGGFHALVDNTIEFLSRNDNDSNKVLYNYKRVELTLRKYLTRLELIRRDLPARYESYVRKLVKYIREARSKAVEPLFDDSVVPGNKPI